MKTPKMSTNDRIRAVKERFYGTNVEFANRLKKNPQFISNIMRKGYNVSPQTLRVILDATPEVSEEWLLQGEGSMVRANKSMEEELHINNHGVRFYELSDQMYTIEVPFVSKDDYEYFHEQCLNFKYSKFEKLKRAFFISQTISNSSYIGFEVQGSAMKSTNGRGLGHGDIVYAREESVERLPHAIFLSFNPYWIIVHKKGVMCRSIDFTDIDKGEITAVSTSGKVEHPDIQFNLKDIIKLYNVEKRSSVPT